MINRISAVVLAAVALLFVSLAQQDSRVAAQSTSPPRTCGKAVIYDASTNGATQLVPPTSGPGSTYTGSIFICGYAIATASQVNVGFVYGTGTNCATGQTKITPAWEFAATSAGIAHIDDNASQFRGLAVPAGQNLCINASAGDAVQAIVYYDNNPA